MIPDMRRMSRPERRESASGPGRPADPAAGRAPHGLRRRCSAGYTLAELLVTLVVTGMIGAGVVGLLMGQTEFYGASEDRSFADLSRRGVSELVSTELRMLATSDLYKTKGDSIRARFDLRQAVVCDVDNTLDYVTLVVHHEPNISLPSGRTGTAVSSPFAADFVYADGWTSSLVSEGGTAVTVCDANGAPSTLPSERYRVEDWSGHPSGLPPVGSVVRVYGDLVYTFEPSQQGAGLALWRNDQELVAPFSEGAEFNYIMNNGSKEVSVPNASQQDIRHIRVSAEAIGDGTNRYDVARDFEIDISFRN